MRAQKRTTHLLQAPTWAHHISLSVRKRPGCDYPRSPYEQVLGRRGARGIQLNMAWKARIRSVIEPVGPFALFAMRRSHLAVGFGPARLEIQPTGHGSATTPQAYP